MGTLNIKRIPYAGIADQIHKGCGPISETHLRTGIQTVLTDLLGISCLVVTIFALRREDDVEVMHITCGYRSDVAIFPKCGAFTDSVHEEKERCVRHLDIWGKRTFLHFLSRRFKCAGCGKEFTEELDFVDQCRRQTLDFETHICHLCLSDNRKAVAKRECLSQSTVKGIFLGYSKKKFGQGQVGRCPKVLGIDEISLRKRHQQFALVLSDVERRCIVDMLPDRSNKNLEKRLDGFDETEKKGVRYVSIDMWKPHYDAVREKLPKARIVVDRFHVVKHLNERITSIRRKGHKKASKEIAKVFKGGRWILVRNRKDLSAKDEEKLNKILDPCKKLREIYLLKEEYRYIFEKARDRQKAEKYLRVWKLKAMKTGNSFLLKFVKTLENWWNEIL